MKGPHLHKLLGPVSLIRGLWEVARTLCGCMQSQKGRLYHYRDQILTTKAQVLPAALWYKRGNSTLLSELRDSYSMPRRAYRPVRSEGQLLTFSLFWGLEQRIEFVRPFELGYTSCAISLPKQKQAQVVMGFSEVRSKPNGFLELLDC